MKIFIIEDQPEIKINYFIDFLKEEGYKFEYDIVGNIVDAFKYLSNNKDFDLVIMDLGLPDDARLFNYSPLGGISILEHMLRHKIKVPIIVNSTTVIANEEEYFSKFYYAGIPIKHVSSIVDDRDDGIIQTFIKTGKIKGLEEENI